MDLLLLSLSCISVLIIYLFINKFQNRTQLTSIFSLNLVLLLVWDIALILQLSFKDVNPIYFDYVAYIAICFIPITMLLMGLIFANTKIRFKKRYLLLFIVPAISLILLWTNDLHHLFYISYSVSISEAVFGPYFIIHSIYTYGLLFIALFYLLVYSIRNSGFFSKQSLLILAGTLVPILINLLGYLGFLNNSIYTTPISFSVGMIFYAFAIFKLKFLRVTPIALQRIVDRMSDGYIVLNGNNVITDFNNTFLNTFGLKSNDVRDCNIVDLINKLNETSVNIDNLLIILDKIKHTNETFKYEKHFKNLNKYFNIEVNSIKSNDKYIGTLVLLKDITQHVKDMNTIKSNQDLLVEKERLASLGQLVGGIAHNLKTPIMSIAGAAEGLTDLVKEYDSSIDDPEVTSKDHHDIAHDMDVWIEKIKTHTSYMSDVITAVKGQAVNLNEEEQDTFTIDELMKRVNILMKHELKNALIDLNINTNSTNSIILHGNVNGLVQVINNLISNAIQAYNGVPNKSIDLTVTKKDSEIIISVQDYGCGIPKEVQDKLFKEMITTKGKNGTGLGLFMSYSTIRGHFDGNITFESKEGVGTRFDIILPL